VLKNALDLYNKKTRAFPCPSCGYWVPRGPILRKPFNCRGCGKVLILSTPEGYVIALVFAVPALIAVLVAHFAGTHGGDFLFVALVVFFLASIIAFFEAATIFGKLEVVYPPPHPKKGGRGWRRH